MANVIKLKRGSGSDPAASDLVVGEIAIRSDTGKLFTKKDNGTVAEISGSGGGASNFFINTLSSSSGSGGGSASFNGTATRFTLSNPPSTAAQQLLVSVNGVIQKPNSGTSPSEGFAIDGNDIIFAAAPATGADFFIITYAELAVGVPSDNSVTSAKIADGAIVNGDVSSTAAIAGTKISPDFGSQNITTTGNVTLNDNVKAIFGTGSDLQIFHDGSNSRIKDVGTGILSISVSQLNIQNAAVTENMAEFFENGAVNLYYDNSKKFETITGGANVTGALGVNTTTPASTIDARADSGATIIARNTGTAASIAMSVGSSTNQLVSRGANVSTARDLIFMVGSTTATRLDSNGHLRPETDSTFDLGSNTVRWRNFYADTLYGDGSNLTGVTSTTLNGNTDHNVMTGTGTANTLQGESTFTHNPSTLDTSIIHNSNSPADLIIQNNSSGTAANARLTLTSGANANSGPIFEMNVGSDSWTFLTPKNAGNLDVNDNGSLAFRFAGDGDFDIVDGDLVIGTSGHGIDFSATSGSGTSELLNDYEEGTWTPDWRGASALGTTSYGSYNVGSYIKIGDQVTVRGYSEITGSSGGSGMWFINNLPFIVKNGHAYRSVGSVLIENFNLNSDIIDVVCYSNPNVNDMHLRGNRDDANYSANISVQNDTDFQVAWTLTYQVA